MSAETDRSAWTWNLVTAFEALDEKFQKGGLAAVPCDEFALAVGLLAEVFLKLGVTMQIAANDLKEKKEHMLKPEVKAACPNIQVCFDACEQDGTVATRGSNARMLNCLKRGVHFVYVLLDRLQRDPSVKMYDAAVESYKLTLEPYHTMMVRMACNGGFMLLPYRETFLKSLEETEETFKVSANAYMKAAKPLLDAIEKMYENYPPSKFA